MQNFIYTLKCFLVIFLIKRNRTQQLALLPQAHIKPIVLLDTEYVAIIATAALSPKESDFLVAHISLYRRTIRPSLKDIVLYRIGAYMDIFSLADKEVIEQQNWKLTFEQRQQVNQFVVERIGIKL